jgi:hypothetical protein
MRYVSLWPALPTNLHLIFSSPGTAVLVKKTHPVVATSYVHGGDVTGGGSKSATAVCVNVQGMLRLACRADAFGEMAGSLKTTFSLLAREEMAGSLKITVSLLARPGHYVWCVSIHTTWDGAAAQRLRHLDLLHTALGQARAEVDARRARESGSVGGSCSRLIIAGDFNCATSNLDDSGARCFFCLCWRCSCYCLMCIIYIVLFYMRDDNVCSISSD